MSDTPRTDAALSLHYSEGDYFGEDTTQEAYEFARGLERELAEAQELIKSIGCVSSSDTVRKASAWLARNSKEES